MKKELDNIQLLETPVGTDMYLMIMNRTETRAILRKVQYAGYSVHTAHRSYYEPNMREEARWTEPEFTVKFTEKGKKTPIAVTCKYISYWKGNRAYDTDYHEECGADVKGIKLTGFGFDTYGSCSCLDVYFSTDKQKIADRFNNSKVVDNLNEAKANIDNMINKYQEFFK